MGEIKAELSISSLINDLMEIGYEYTKFAMDKKREYIQITTSKVYKDELYFIKIVKLGNQFDLMFLLNNKIIISIKDQPNNDLFIAKYQQMIRFHKRKDWDYKIIKHE